MTATKRQMTKRQKRIVGTFLVFYTGLILYILYLIDPSSLLRVSNPPLWYWFLTTFFVGMLVGTLLSYLVVRVAKRKMRAKNEATAAVLSP